MPRFPEPEPFEHHPDALPPLRHVVEPPVQVEVLERGQFPVDERLVAEVADLRPRHAHRQLALARQREPRAQPQQGRLAGAVRPGDEREAAVGDVEVDPAQHALLAEALAEPARSDHPTSASATTKAAKATLITPFMVKKAASRRRKSPGRTSECSYASRPATTATPSQ